MQNFSKISYNINESKITLDSLNKFLKKFKKTIPSDYKQAIEACIKYNITDSRVIDLIGNSTKPQLVSVINNLNLTLDDAQYLWNIFRYLKGKPLPQYYTPSELKNILGGKFKFDDLLMDLSTSKGRNEVVKKYMGLIYKIVNNFIGKTRLSKSDLLSVALEGFNAAMSDYNFKKGLSFMTYAGVRTRQAILDEINTNGHTLSGTNWYASANNNNLDAKSLSNMFGDDEEAMDRIGALASYDPMDTESDSEEKQWKKLFGLMEKKFSQRDMDIFYKFFGLNGYKREKSKDIAKSYGMSLGNIRNSIINKIINFLKNNPAANSTLAKLQDIYTESLMCELCGCGRDEIVEALINDDTFILLEDINMWRWGFNDYLNNALSHVTNPDRIMEMLKTDLLYTDLRENKDDVVNFLSWMYPQENIKINNDNYLIEMMSQIRNYIK